MAIEDEAKGSEEEKVNRGREVLVTRFSDGTICDYCSNLVLTKIGLEYVQDGHIFCCKECADDFKEKYLKS